MEALSEHLGCRCRALANEQWQEDVLAVMRGVPSPHVLCGTPGTLEYLIKRKLISLKHVRMLVIDEAGTVRILSIINHQSSSLTFVYK